MLIHFRTFDTFCHILSILLPGPKMVGHRGGDPRGRSLERHCSKQVGEDWKLNAVENVLLYFVVLSMYL